MRVLSMFLILFAGLSASAGLVQFDYAAIQQQTMQQATMTAGLDWTINDRTQHNLNAGFIQGKMDGFVREEVAQGFWVEQNLDLGFAGQQKVETLFDKNTGQVIKMLVDGKEQDLPDPSNYSLEEMKEDSVTVPAGTFDCVYVKVRDTSNDKVQEAWVNQESVPISGMIKTLADSPFGKVTVELVSFSFAP